MPSTAPPTRRQAILGNVNHTLNCISIASVFAIHFLLAVAVLISDGFYYHSREMRPYFAYYNAFFFLTLFWSVHEHLKPGPLQMATVVNLVSIVFDIIVAANVEGPSLLLIIINILFRPLSAVVLLRKSYLRKRRFNLHTSEATSLGTAIKNLLYSQGGDVPDPERPYGKDPLPHVLSTLPSATAPTSGQTNAQRELA